MKLYAVFDEDVYHNEYDGDDEWSRNTTTTEWKLKNVLLVKKTKFRNNENQFSIDVADEYKHGDVAFVVWACWSSGDSFGWDDDKYAEVFGVFKTYNEAEKLEQILWNWKKATRGDEKAYGIYIPWTDMFSNLSYVQLDEMRIV